MFLLLLPLALAGTPDRVAWTSAQGTDVVELEATADGRWVALVESASGELRLLDTLTWDTTDIAACPASIATSATVYETDSVVRVYVGCDDSTIAKVDYDAGWTLSDTPVDIGEGSVLGVQAAADAVFAVVLQDDTAANPAIHHINPDTDAIDDYGSYPQTLGYSGYVDMAGSEAYLIIGHGSDNLSKVDLGSGSPVIRQLSQSQLDVIDIIYLSSGIFLASGGTAVAEFQLSDNELALYIDSGDGLEGVGGMCELTDEEELLVADHDRGEIIIFPLSAGSGGPGDVEIDTIAYPEGAGSARINEMVRIDGYVVAGTNSGEIWVLTDRPWVTVEAPSISSGVAGDEVVITFSADEAGDWELYLNGDEEDGTLLDSGELEADESVESTVVIDTTWVEGDNQLVVVVTDSDSNAGRDGATVSVDNPPGKVSLSQGDLGFGNSQLSLSFEGLDDADLASYQLYLSTEAFSPDDYSTGGPAFEGEDKFDESDLSLTSFGPGETVSVTLSPLTNGTTYYVAVRAFDEGGQEGPMSDVISGTPLETFGAAALAGEEGGHCGVSVGASWGLAALAGLFALGRRRRGAFAGAALGAMLVAPAQAASSDDPYDPEIRHGHVQLRVGPLGLSDPTLTQVFGETGNEMIWLEAGPSFGELLELKLGVGWMQEMGWLIAEDGSVSDEHDMLTLLPVTAGATLRLDFFEEQVLVPYASAGGDYWLWRENWYVNPDVGGEDRIGGGKYGWHWALGAQVLLDAFDSNRASKLNTRTGIDDSYLVFEWRDQSVGEYQSGLQFSGTGWTLGLKVHY